MTNQPGGGDTPGPRPYHLHPEILPSLVDYWIGHGCDLHLDHFL